MRLLGSARFVSASGGMTTVAVEGLGWVGLGWLPGSRSSLVVWLDGWLLVDCKCD